MVITNFVVDSYIQFDFRYRILSNTNVIYWFQVRKTSVRMTAIKEYPFDLSDLKNKPNESPDSRPAPLQAPTSVPADRKSIPSRTPSSASGIDGKRKVSIMADESSKDRENLPSER